jgi:hypothetical protein
MTIDVERTAEGTCPKSMLRNQLNLGQLVTLAELEHYGWELRFIRRTPLHPSTPVVFHADCKRFAVLRDDGSLDMDPGFHICD